MKDNHFQCFPGNMAGDEGNYYKEGNCYSDMC